jgi:hypothetical protein
MLPATQQYLAERDFVQGTRINRLAIAQACANLLASDPVTMDDEIQAKAKIVAEIRHAILGDPGDPEVAIELDTLISGLTGMNSATQGKLENGYVLCSARVKRELSNNGHGTVPVSRAGRFVTSTPDLIVAFYWVPQRNKLVHDAEMLSDRVDIGTRRQPQLGEHRRPLLTEARDRVDEILATAPRAIEGGRS